MDKTKKPLSIANTVNLFKENNPEHNSKQIVRKFLGDFLQGVEAVVKKIGYYSGDKPASAMYYLLHSLVYSNDYSKGGYVEKSKTGDDGNIYNNNPSNSILEKFSPGLSTQPVILRTVQGGGKKKKRSSRKKRKHISHKRKMINELKEFNKYLKKSLKKSRKKSKKKKSKKKKSKKKKSLTSGK